MKPERTLLPIHRILGTVVRGRGIGKHVGTPTADLRPAPGARLPEPGVYCAALRLEGREYRGVAHIGPHPTLEGGRNCYVEAHLFDFHGDLYGRAVERRLYKLLREVRRYDDLSGLLAQIRRDCPGARRFWGLPRSARLEMDPKRRSAAVNGQAVALSAKEFDLLFLLYTHPNRLFSKQQLYEAVWRQPALQRCHAVKNTVFQIRRRLRPCAPDHDFIQTVAGFGYQFRPGDSG